MTTIQIILLCILAAVLQVDVMTVGLLPSNTIITGILSGIVMGDPTLGLVVGATLQSYALGLNYFGGASIPNYQIAAIIVVALCGGDIDNVASTIALVGIPVAALTVQLDVLGRIINSYWQHKIDAVVPSGNLNKIIKIDLCGILTWSLTRLAPVLICLLIGPNLVETLNALMPEWLSAGFTIASKVFPAIGFTILLKYMPLKGNWQYLIIGFVLSAYFGASTIAVACVGLAIALFVYNFQGSSDMSLSEETGGNYDE